MPPRTEISTSSVGTWNERPSLKLNDPTARQILRGALLDQDARVQANAVEAAEETGDPAIIRELLPKLGSPDNRVRANAVKALLRLGVREAAQALLLMLKHPNRAHRISALWLIDHMGLFPVATRVFELARADEDPVVRDRAKNLASRLSASLAVTGNTA